MTFRIKNLIFIDIDGNIMSVKIVTVREKLTISYKICFKLQHIIHKFLETEYGRFIDYGASGGKDLNRR